MHNLAVDLFFSLPPSSAWEDPTNRSSAPDSLLLISHLTSLDSSKSELFMGFYFLCAHIIITLLLNLPLNWASQCDVKGQGREKSNGPLGLSARSCREGWRSMEAQVGTDESSQPGCKINWAGRNTEKEGIALLPQLLTAGGGVWLDQDGAGGGWRSFISMDHLGFPKLRVMLSISFQLVSLLP